MVNEVVNDKKQSPLTKFDEILSRLKVASGVETTKELGKILGVRGQAVTSARKRGEIPAGWLVKVGDQFNISLDWLLYGEGLKLREEIERLKFHQEGMRSKNLEGHSHEGCCEGVLSREGHMLEEEAMFDLDIMNFIWKEVAQYTQKQNIPLTKERQADVLFLAYSFLALEENHTEAHIICSVVQDWLNMTEEERRDYMYSKK